MSTTTIREWCEGCTCGKAGGGKQVSECLNCDRGDEHRCSTCPSRGTPATRVVATADKVEIVDLEEYQEPGKSPSPSWSSAIEIGKLNAGQITSGAFITTTQLEQMEFEINDAKLLFADWEPTVP